MKRIFSIVLVATLALFTACDKADNATVNHENGANFQLTSASQVAVDANGGDQYITYTIANKVLGASVQAGVKTGSSSDGVKSVTTPMDGLIVVEFDANTTSSTRIVIITASYDNESFDVVFSQKAGGSTGGKFDVEFEAKHLNGYYYGEKYGAGADRYAFYLSDNGMNNGGQAYTNSTYYYIDAFAPAHKSTTLPNGTYTFSFSDNNEPYTVVGANSQLICTGVEVEDTTYTLYTDARMIVSTEQIVLELTINGKRHKVTYNGSLVCQDASGENGDNGDDSGGNNNPTDGQDGQAMSTYTSDHHVTFDGEHRAKWGYEGDYWKTGYSNYTIYIMNKSNGYVYGDTLQFDLITDNKSQDGDFDGKYTISNTPGKMVMMAGFTNNYAQSVGSWLYEYGGASASGYANYAMLKSGTAEFINNGDGTHTVKLNAYDYKGNNITCNWTGVIEKD